MSKQNHSVTQQELQQQFNVAAKKEVALIRSRFHQANISEIDYKRLENLSFLGQDMALNLLDEISQSGSDFASRASSIADARRGYASMQSLIKLASNPKFARRKQSLNTLRKIHHPLVLSALGKIIRNSNEKDDIRIQAIEVCADFGDAFSVNFLKDVAEDETLSKAIRDTASNGRQRVLISLEVASKHK